MDIWNTSQLSRRRGNGRDERRRRREENVKARKEKKDVIGQDVSVLPDWPLELSSGPMPTSCSGAADALAKIPFPSMGCPHLGGEAGIGRHLCPATKISLNILKLQGQFLPSVLSSCPTTVTCWTTGLNFNCQTLSTVTVRPEGPKQGGNTILRGALSGSSPYSLYSGFMFCRVVKSFYLLAKHSNGHFIASLN